MIRKIGAPARHCEERSDEAIQAIAAMRSLDCFASLAMTTERRLPNTITRKEGVEQ
ncbi:MULTISPECIES: hypothetical protein [Bradyrhizobium]|uniref:hypothetical protein n=1 Tax=Bradyrhizobium TaxID=374 RepID=UPI00155EE228|nr:MULTISPECIES: hypothetical protein [Bradyrhizobium]